MSFRAISVGLAGLLLAASAAAAPAGSPQVDRGRLIVQRNCSMCHAVGRTGDSPNPAAPHFRDLSERYPIDDLAEALAEGIVVGHPEMPQFRFSSQEVSDILAYLQSIQTRQHASAPRGGPG